MGVDELALERPVDVVAGVVVGVGEVAPAVEMHRHVHGLAAVADEVAPVAEVAHHDQLAQLAIGGEPPAVDVRGGRALAQPVGAPIAEVLHQLLVAVDDRIGQPARLPAVGMGRGERLLVGLAVGRQGVEGGSAQHLARIVQVDEVAGVEVGVVRLPGPAGAVGLARQLAKAPDRLGRLQEVRDLGRQGLGGDGGDQPVAGVLPGQGRRGAERKDGTQGEEEAAHLTSIPSTVGADVTGRTPALRPLSRRTPGSSRRAGPPPRRCRTPG